jgi:hypothetical protein
VKLKDENVAVSFAFLCSRRFWVGLSVMSASGETNNLSLTFYGDMNSERYLSAHVMKIIDFGVKPSCGARFTAHFRRAQLDSASFIIPKPNLFN